MDFRLTSLQFAFQSNYDSGASGVPVPAPFLPPSVFGGMRLNTLLQKIVPFFATTTSNDYGFPVPVVTDYTGVSNMLSDPTLPPIKDIVPYQIVISSEYAIHDLEGQTFITISFNELFDFCKKQLGCGASIEYDTSGKPTILRIEDLKYFFDKDTMIYDLGYDVANFTISQMSDGIGANLKLGYTKADTNSDFGVDAFNTELFFNTPLSNLPAVMDYEETSILCEMYAIEKLRAQKVSQPIGAEYNPANPSQNNQSIGLYCDSETVFSSIYALDPSNIGVVASANPYPVLQFSTAQSTDNTAASAPYVFGLYYPDTAINLPLSPCRALQRSTGAYLHSVLDEMDSERLTFRNTGVMQFNNQVKDLSGIESNLVVGSGAGNVTTEFKDVQIGSLPDQLFKPIIFKVTSKYPVNLYSILQNNPNGYIRFFWKNEAGFGYTEYKMFLIKATQKAATGAPTEFVGWAHPSTIL